MRPRFPLKALFGASLVGQAVAFLVACCLPATRKTPPAHGQPRRTQAPAQIKVAWILRAEQEANQFSASKHS